MVLAGPEGQRLARRGYAPPRGHWFDRVLRWRDRLMADARFQRWASTFPLTRPVARRHAGELFDLCAGFVYSQVLAACVRLKLFEKLWEGPQTPDDLAVQCDLPADAMRRLLAAAEALGLVAKRAGGRYGLAMLGAALHGNPGIAAMVEHHAMLYEDLRDPVALLRGALERTELSRYWAYAVNESAAGLGGAEIAGYTALMSSSQALIADDILSAYDFGRHACLLDVGGGEGAFLAAAAARVPALELVLFDLPAVAETAAARFAASGLAGRAQVHGGSFLTDPLPSGADLITLNRILLDHDDATVATLLRAVRRAIPEGGVLLIAETMSGLAGSRAVADAYFGFYLLAMGRGRPRSLSEIRDLLEAAGFSRIRPIATRRPLLTNLVAARPC